MIKQVENVVGLLALISPRTAEIMGPTSSLSDFPPGFGPRVVLSGISSDQNSVGIEAQQRELVHETQKKDVRSKFMMKNEINGDVFGPSRLLESGNDIDM